jgi:CRP/FNR family transcriptional regulator, nitrogen fixation regulation protein
MMRMDATKNGKPPGAASSHDRIFDVIKTLQSSPRPFVDERTIKGALSALQRGPIHFCRNNVIACEGDAADYIFLVVSGVVRTCKTFQNGTRNVVAFYLPGDLFGLDDQKCALSAEAATDAMVLFIKRSGLLSLAARESRVSSFLLAVTTGELRRAREHGLLMNRNAKCRVATFLTDLSKRLGKTGSIDLPMSHQDIADHLGLTIETLSRTITGLEQSGVIARASPRTLTVRNQYSLTRLMT